MNKITANLNIKKVQDMYNVQSVTENGQINLKDKYVIIYKIDPANIIACDEETKYKIYQAYLTCIRGLPDVFQIIVSKDSLNFDEQIIEYKTKMKEVSNDRLRYAIEKYIEYLKEIENSNKLYKTNHYLIVKSVQKDRESDITNIFSNLEEFGVRVSQVKSKQQVENILRRYVQKD